MVTAVRVPYAMDNENASGVVVPSANRVTAEIAV